jgi:hypothetical protein
MAKIKISKKDAGDLLEVLAALSAVQLHLGQVAELFGAPAFVMVDDDRLDELSETIFNKLMDLNPE